MREPDETALPNFYDRPVLVVDPGAHTAPITRADVDAAGQFAVTASLDSTVRVWLLADGSLLRTIRLPSGPDDAGQARSVALDPAGEIIAVGGKTNNRGQSNDRVPDESIYLYDRVTGELRQRIGGLPNMVVHLAFGQGGQYLAATLMGPRGLRVYTRDHTRDHGWAEVARDSNYRLGSHGAAFAPDGRLATTSEDGWVRLYASDFRLQCYTRPDGGLEPYGVAFSPSGDRLAVGFADSTQVAVMDGRSLAPLHAVVTAGIDNGDLGTVAWVAENQLIAGGRYGTAAGRPVLAWAEAGLGPRRVLPAGRNTVVSLRSLPGGDVLVVGADPFLGRVTEAGVTVWSVRSPLADFSAQCASLAVAVDGTAVDFGFENYDQAPARFDLGRLALTHAPPADGRTAKPPTRGLPGWDTDRFAGAPLLTRHEKTHAVGIHPDRNRFILGTEWCLRACDVYGYPLWRRTGPPIYAVNVTGDGRLVVAARADGTIRWHRMDDGGEILAFMPLADRRNWIVWTPEGFYAASPGGHGVLRWHVNRPDWQPAKDYAVADIPGFYRPEAIKLVLQEMETPRAIGLAVLAGQRAKVRLLINSRVPPGARLHLLTIGISCYDAAHLRLNFAQQDAHDVISALTSTQDQLWVAGTRQYLADADASRPSIWRALETLRQAMRNGDDLAVVLFSGHGAMVDNELYLLPKEAQAGDAVALKDTALPVADLRRELLRIAEGGRVLVLLDACYSGGVSLDGHSQPAASNAFSTALAAANISVLASSSADQPSRENADWQNGAFTEAFLEALGAADEDNDGLISPTELARYLDRRVRNLTDGKQQPAFELRFDSTLFAVR